MKNRLVYPFLLISVAVLISPIAISTDISGDNLSGLSGSTQFSNLVIDSSSAFSDQAAFSKPGNIDSSGVTADNFYMPDDPYYSKQWSLIKFRLPEKPLKLSNLTPIKVAILDTGIDKNHEDLTGKIIAEVNLSRGDSVLDINGHGTHIAGIIAANSNNNIGIAGIAPECQLLNVKIADDNGRSQVFSIAEGIRWAIQQGANVINISVAFEEPSVEVEDAVNFAWEQGAVVVASASNEKGDIPIYPGSYQNCLSVIATGPDDQVSPITYSPEWIDLSAPGLSIYSTQPHNCYGYRSGTSFASAFVSGLAAQLFTTVQDVNGNGQLNDEVVEALRSMLDTGVGQYK